jgi:DNA repair exonuclease SbcCD nuclease subunit
MVTDNETTCPISGCSYTGPLASVAAHISGKRDAAHDWGRLGYDGANHYKREQRNQLKDDTSYATIGWLTDSHIGKKTGGYGNYSWDISPVDDLRSVTELLGSFDLDTVVYTGDLFHNDKDGISNANQRLVRSLIESNLGDSLPIKYIYGNHARGEGSQVWSDFEQHQIAEPLSTDPIVIGNTAIYGIDFHKEKWWKRNSPRLQPTNAEYRILCLHQSVEPYRTADSSEIDLRTRLPKLSRVIEGVPEFVVLGHLHEVIDDTLTIDGQEVRVVNHGATTRLGQHRDSFVPSCGLILPKPDGPQYVRIHGD